MADDEVEVVDEWTGERVDEWTGGQVNELTGCKYFEHKGRKGLSLVINAFGGMLRLRSATAFGDKFHLFLSIYPFLSLYPFSTMHNVAAQYGF